MSIGKTIAEKIFSKKNGQDLYAGDVVIVKIDYGMTHDINAMSVIEMFDKLNKKQVREPEKFSVFIDHLVPSPTVDVANTHRKMMSFAKEYNLNLYMPGEGICHQIALEKNSVLPGNIAIGTDSHTCTYGIMNAISMSVGASEMAVALASSECWFKVPETIRIELLGKLKPPASAKDITLEMLKRIGESGASYKCVEFGGEGLNDISMDGRAVLTNMCTEMGAKSAVIEPDNILINFMKKSGINEYELFYPDKDANYNQKIDIQLDGIKPMVTIPPHIDKIMNVSVLKKIAVTQVVIGSCTNGRIEDFTIAADILKGRHIAIGLNLIIVPASVKVYREMIKTGVLDILVSAGAIINPPGCGPCAGTMGGLAADNDIVVSTTNRCLEGRMGSKLASIYIASPATAAYSAVLGYLACGYD